MSFCFSVDGLPWDIPCRIERTAAMTASEISGLLLDKSYFNDVLGTYLRYDITVVVPKGYESAYDALYEKLTEPVDAHAFVLPYNSGTITVTGRVENVRDVWRRVPGGGNCWVGTAFTVAANHPTKELSLGEVITRGASPLPSGEAVQTGASYTYTSDGWAPIADADATAY